MAGRVVVGPSSWADPGFVEEWYPPGMPARDRLAWYAERFEAVEVNASFYAVPARRTVKRWCEVTPDGFTFDVKLHRVLSRHSAKVDALPPELRDGAKTNDRGRVLLDERLEAALADAFLVELEPLCAAGKLATLLLQLSPAFKPGAHELDELAGLIERLAPHPVAIELRHIGWVDGDRLASTLSWLSEHDAAFVCTDGPQGDAPTMMPPVDAATRDDVAYVRAHGRNVEGYKRGRTVAERFGWDYADSELEEIAGRTAALAEEVPVVRMMFNNNRGGDAPRAAERMRALVS